MKVQTRLITVHDARDPFITESGAKLSSVQVAYETYGTLSRSGDNVILICHALSGDAHAAGEGVYSEELLREIPFYRSMKEGQPGWWDGAIGPGKTFDTNRYFVVCTNILGSCYGTTGPASINPQSGQFYQSDFPEVSVQDMVRVQRALLEKIGVKRLQAVCGGSLGGMQALEWALLYPQWVDAIIPIATASGHSAWGIAFNHLARQAVMNDPQWKQGKYDRQPGKGLGLARQIGMVSYRTDISFQARFGRDYQPEGETGGESRRQFKVESYLDYQGRKMVSRFDANSFITISRAIDQHDVSRGRVNMDEALGRIKARTLCIGIDTDVLYPAEEQKQIAARIPGARYAEMRSANGHDAFLIEFGQLQDIITPFLDENSCKE